jgi:hypothetical protein
MGSLVKLLAIIVFVGLLGLLGAFFLMICWNAVIPDIIGWKSINFTQSILLISICSILFRNPSAGSK